MWPSMKLSSMLFRFSPCQMLFFVIIYQFTTLVKIIISLKLIRNDLSYNPWPVVASSFNFVVHISGHWVFASVKHNAQNRMRCASSKIMCLS